MLLSLRPVDDCLIKVHDVCLIAVYESQNKFEECSLLNVSCQRKDGDIFNYENICDIEVF